MFSADERHVPLMRLYSLLISVVLLGGAVRFSGISLFDEASFLLLLILLLFYRQKGKSECQFNPPCKYLENVIRSFRLLFFYLLFSLVYGLVYDPYFGKIRWLIVLAGMLFCDAAFLHYLQRKFMRFHRLRHISLVYRYCSGFALFYILYGLCARYLFGIPPGNIQDAQTGEWFAIWGTSAYTAIIFLPLMVFNKALRVNRVISQARYIFSYVIIAISAIFYDSRVTFLILTGFLAAEFASLKRGSRFITGGGVAIFIVTYGAQIDLATWSSSGGFLLSLMDNESENLAMGDFDRVAHYIAAFNTMNSSFLQGLIGAGFLNAGKAIIPEYLNVYSEYGVSIGSMSNNLSGVSKGTFGLSAYLVENGLIGTLLLCAHIYNLCIFSIKTKLLLPSSFVVAMYAGLILLFFSIYINDNLAFYFLLSPVFLFSLIDKNNFIQKTTQYR